jgi:L-amino acid N-acyltransferase YncA
VNKIEITPISQKEISACLAIYKPFVTDSIVSFELDSPSEEEFANRVESITRKYPWFVAKESNEVIGYAYASAYRDRLAYQWNVEVSVYVHSHHKNKKVGTLLYNKLFEELRKIGICKAFAVIALPNDASVGFHKSFGFNSFATFKNVGHKFEAWHDVHWMEFQIQLPKQPTFLSTISSLE